MESYFESPLRYPGGKAAIYPFVSKLFFENNLVGIRYAEPYAGGAGLALKLLYREMVSEILINDLDVGIYAFWKTLLSENIRFCDWLERVVVNVENWHYYKYITENPEVHSDFQKAKAIFFLNRTNVSGVIKGGIIGGVKQLGKYKIDARFNREDLLKRIAKIHGYAHRIEVSNLDGLAFIEKMNRQKKDVFIYLDPPYYLKGADLYMNFYKTDDHKRLATTVDSISKKWMVSYDKSDVITSLYEKHSKIKYALSQSASNRVGEEIFVFSPQLAFQEAISHLKSPVII